MTDKTKDSDCCFCQAVDGFQNSASVSGECCFFTKDRINTHEQNRRELLDKLIDISLDNRKFEIDLLWKRSNTFWLFTAALLVAVGYTFKTASSGVLFIFTITGLTFSFIWSLVNIGSKFWQESWEEKTSLYFKERYNYPDLLSKIKEDQSEVFLLLGAKNFSLSRLMIATSHFFILFWGAMSFYFAYKYNLFPNFHFTHLAAYLYLAVALIYMHLVWRFTKGKSNNLKTKEDLINSLPQEKKSGSKNGN